MISADPALYNAKRRVTRLELRLRSAEAYVKFYEERASGLRLMLADAIEGLRMAQMRPEIRELVESLTEDEAYTLGRLAVAPIWISEEVSPAQTDGFCRTLHAKGLVHFDYSVAVASRKYAESGKVIATGLGYAVHEARKIIAGAV